MANLSETYLGRKARYLGAKYGLELENEIVDTPMKNADTDYIANVLGWTFHAEGSLRHHGYEMVSKPMSFLELKKSLLLLDPILKNYKWTNSARTSTHIHINVQDLTEEQLMIFCCSYWIFEPLFLKYAGVDREKNTFCVSSTPEKFMLLQNTQLKRRLMDNFSEDAFKYCSLNLCPVKKLGTVETRIMRGSSDVLEIIQWLGMIHRLRDSIDKFNSLSDLKKKFLDLEIDDFVSIFYSKKEFDYLKKNFDYKSLLREGFKNTLNLYPLQTYLSAKKEDPKLKDQGILYRKIFNAAPIDNNMIWVDDIEQLAPEADQ